MIILASKSASRQVMLRDAGVAFDARPADLDERAIEAKLDGAAPADIALALAKAKALAARGDGSLVLGSDSLVVVEGRRFDKPQDRSEAAEHLRYFSGRAMELHAAAALVRDGSVVWSHAAIARLKVRPLSEEFIASYLDAEWPEVGYCVGVFRIEALGIQLFDSIEGSHFTVLGMPLLPLLEVLREYGELPR